MGTCIGKRNHKYFVSFLGYTAFHASFSFATALVTVVNQFPFYFKDGTFMYTNYPTWVLLIYAAMMTFTLVPFCSYHVWLLSSGRTTNEEVRQKYHQWRGNPFDRGTWQANCKDGCITHPSRVFTPPPGEVRVSSALDEEANK